MQWGQYSRRTCTKISLTRHCLRTGRRSRKDGNVGTLATFRIGQAVTAVGAWCAYIAPYVNTLEAHFVKRRRDKMAEGGLGFCLCLGFV